MIREYKDEDILSINCIGNQIKNDFAKVFNIENLSNNVENIYVYEQNNKIIGFIHISKSFEVIDIINIAVDLNYQRKGIAMQLINYIIDALKPERILLEVRKSNHKAISLYEKCHFKVINIRKNYYGSEDALVMELNLL